MSRTRTNEQGMVSILITMIMIIVITLIVLGFSEVARRNQREALDNQLSTQAYYAAESGVNAAANFLSTYSGAPISNSGCTDFVTAPASPPPGTPGGLGGSYGSSSGDTNVLDSGTHTQYTCLMVNTVPGSLQVKPLSQDTSEIWRIEDSTNSAFTSFKFTWHQSSTIAAAAPDICDTAGKNPGYDGAAPPTWRCHYGILRVDLLAIPASGTIDNATLESPQSTTTLYLEPSYPSGSNSSSLALPTAATTPCSGANCPAQIVHVRCTAATDCHVTLNLNPAGAKAEYFARLSMVYEDAADVTLTAQDAAGGALFKDGQAIVDSTGQSQDELRRVQVRIPLVRPPSSVPSFALQSTDSICKQIMAGPAASGVPYTDACP